MAVTYALSRPGSTTDGSSSLIPGALRQSPLTATAPASSATYTTDGDSITFASIATALGIDDGDVLEVRAGTASDLMPAYYDNTNKKLQLGRVSGGAIVQKASAADVANLVVPLTVIHR
jgi:hypothetical protein